MLAAQDREAVIMPGPPTGGPVLPSYQRPCERGCKLESRFFFFTELSVKLPGRPLLAGFGTTGLVVLVYQRPFR